jgi:hypothetical protein
VLTGEAKKAAELSGPFSAIHQGNATKPPEEYRDCKEGEMEIFESGYGSSRRSAFVAKVGGRSVRGYRATYLSNTSGLGVFCYCPSNSWMGFRPVFQEVLQSVKFGH